MNVLLSYLESHWSMMNLFLKPIFSLHQFTMSNHFFKML